MLHVFPAILELLEYTSATFGEACIADSSIVHQYLSVGGRNGLFDNIG